MPQKLSQPKKSANEPNLVCRARVETRSAEQTGKGVSVARKFDSAKQENPPGDSMFPFREDQELDTTFSRITLGVLGRDRSSGAQKMGLLNEKVPSIFWTVQREDDRIAGSHGACCQRQYRQPTGNEDGLSWSMHG